MREGLLFAAVRWGSLGALVLTSAAIMGSPGPATISLVAAGSAYGVRSSIPYLVGIISGSTLVLVAVATGITAALSALPAVEPALIGISATYILWLAYHIGTAPPLSQQAPTSKAPSLAGGALLGVANPKAWLAIAAVFAGAHLAHAAASDVVAKTGALTAMIIVINTTWLAAGITLAPLLRDPQRARIVNTALALSLVGATALALVH